MANKPKRRVKILLLSVCIAAVAPLQVFAQANPLDLEQESDTAPVEPGRDPFALTPEKLRLFQGYETNEELNSLFSGEGMKNNGLFATPTTQLGGAAPDWMAAVVDNEEEVKSGPTFIVITSEYSPAEDLTKDSQITLKVTLENIGDSLAENVVFRAMLQDNYIIMSDDPAASPPFTNDPAAEIEAGDNGEADEGDAPTPVPTINDPTVNDPYMTLAWETIDGQPINLEPGESQTFSWSFQPTKDDVVIRWRMVAEYGAGESVLRHWIPVKNPNPTGGIAPSGTFNGVNPCATGSDGSGPYPDASSASQIIPLFKQNWNIELVSRDFDYTSPQYGGILKLWWEALTTVECTPFVADTSAGNVIHIIASGEPGGWGWYKGNYNLHMNLGHMVGAKAESIQQNFIHELGHVWRGSNPDKDADFASNISGQGDPNAYVSGYHINSSEDLSSALGYYAIRAANEWNDGGSGPVCPSKNPYDWGQSKYYEWVKANAFGGVEFGPAPPNPSGTC